MDCNHFIVIEEVRNYGTIVFIKNIVENGWWDPLLDTPLLYTEMLLLKSVSFETNCSEKTIRVNNNLKAGKQHFALRWYRLYCIAKTTLCSYSGFGRVSASSPNTEYSCTSFSSQISVLLALLFSVIKKLNMFTFFLAKSKHQSKVNTG